MPEPPRTAKTARPGRVTVTDVARYAGVSSAVVSYVINNGPRPVAVGTAERVRDAIAVLGYRPNSSARALRTGTTRMLGLVLPETTNPFFGGYVDALYQAATEAGLALLTASSNSQFPEEQRLVEQMTRRNVDAILLATSIAIADISHINRPQVPTVLLNCPFPVPGFCTIGPTSAAGSQQVVEHLITEHGHRRIAHIAGDAQVTEGDPREAGWREALRRHDLTPDHLIHATYNSDGGYRAARDLLARTPRPTAIFAASDRLAIGAMYAVQEAGLQVPDDLAIVSFDGIDQTRFTWPPLTVVRQPVPAMARAAVEAAREGAPPGHRVFGTELVLRRSCGCPGGSRPVGP